MVSVSADDSVSVVEPAAALCEPILVVVATSEASGGAAALGSTARIIEGEFNHVDVGGDEASRDGGCRWRNGDRSVGVVGGNSREAAKSCGGGDNGKGDSICGGDARNRTR